MVTPTHTERGSRGFSLIELLFVIALIGLFTSVIISSTNGPRKSARDARRYADLAQMGQALEAYYQLNNAYPSTSLQWRTVCTNGLNSIPYTTTGAQGFIPNIAPQYIPFLPTDPSGCGGAGQYHGYLYISNGVDYKLATDWTAERGDECAPGKQFHDAKHTDSTNAWCAIYTFGAKDW